MRDFKKYTSVRIRKLIEDDGRHTLLNNLKYEVGRQKFKVWQNRFDDVVIYSEGILATKINYIHTNPVKAGFVDNDEDYQFSSALFFSNLDHEDPLCTPML